MKKKLLLRTKKQFIKLGEWLSVGANKTKAYVTYLAFAVLTNPIISFADAGDGSESWNMLMEFILTWLPRLGGLMLFGGGVEYAIAYQSDNANQKTQGTRIMIAGGMVIGLPMALRSLIMI